MVVPSVLLFVACCSLFFVGCWLLVVGGRLRFVVRSVLIVASCPLCCLLFVVACSVWVVVRCLVFVACLVLRVTGLFSGCRCSLFVVSRVLLVRCGSFVVIRCLLFVVCCLSFVV